MSVDVSGANVYHKPNLVCTI